MIVPSRRLLFWVTLVALPFAVVGGLAPSAAGPALAVIGALGFLAALDAALARGRLEGFDARLPAVLRLTQGRPGTLSVLIERPAGLTGRVALRIGLALPADLTSPDETLAVALGDTSQQARLDWAVTAGRRGQYTVPSAHLERPSALGFWLVREARPLAAEVRVYPDLMPDCQRAPSVFLTRGGAGVRRQRQVGRGREFEKLRDYIPGDPLGDIHWKATAKRNRPTTKIYQIERTQEVYFIIDASRLSARPGTLGAGGHGRGDAVKGVQSAERGRPSQSPFSAGAEPGATVLDRFLTAALVACLAAERQGDLFGLVVFSDRVERFIPARNGREHYNLCREALYGVEPRLVSPDFGELFTAIRGRLRRRALLVCLTSLDDVTLAEQFQNGAELIGRHHLMLVNQLRPAGAEELFSRGGVGAPGELFNRLAGHLQWHELRRLQTALARRGVHFSLLDHERLVAELITQYLDIKQRQLL